MVRAPATHCDEANNERIREHEDIANTAVDP